MLLFRRISTSLCLALLVAYLLTASSGCQSSTEANRVDPKLARSTLESVLDSWKRGESIESWQKNDSQVVAQDLDWKAGATLASFEILDSGEALDANAFYRVRLSLVDATTKRSERDVTYIVSTSPVRTVFRSLTP